MISNSTTAAASAMSLGALRGSIRSTRGNWQVADDFALRQAAQGGWKPWHGAARVEQLLRRHPEHLRILGAHEKRLAGSKFVSNPSSRIGAKTPIRRVLNQYFRPKGLHYRE